MTYEIESDAPERVRHEAAQLHELAVNQFGYDTEHVLFTAHADGTISGRIALYVASDYQDSENDDDPDRNGSVEDEATEGSPLNAWNDVSSDQDRDPDPPGIGITVSRPSTNPKTDTAEAGA